MAERDSRETASEHHQQANELRISLVLYGGSSLVIYMNGVTQELLTLVKATSRRAFRHGAQVHDGLLHAYELAARVSQHDIDEDYKTLLQSAGQNPRASQIRDALEARTSGREVVIDVMSGASAGGLNALFLARALLINGDLQRAMDLLIDEGGIIELLNDAQSKHADADHITKSLLDGDRLYTMTIDAMRHQEEDVDPVDRIALVDSIDCFMALTDLYGVPNPDATSAANDERAPEDHDLARNEELDHQMRAHLRYGTRESYGAERNDFFERTKSQSPMLPFLAFVGRATSAHPAAFHPAQLRRCAELANTHLGHHPLGGTTFDPDDPLWERLIQPVHPSAPLQDRWFSDGGDLDNRPFTHAIDPVESRRSVLPVDRKIIWVEPDPSPRSDAWKRADAPTFTEVTFDAFNLPRKEGIHGDLARIEERNRVARLLTASIDEWLPESRRPGNDDNVAPEPSPTEADAVPPTPQMVRQLDHVKRIEDVVLGRAAPSNDRRLRDVEGYWESIDDAEHDLDIEADVHDEGDPDAPVRRVAEDDPGPLPWEQRTPPSIERLLYELERARYVVNHLTEWCRTELFRRGIHADPELVEQAAAKALGFDLTNRTFVDNNHRQLLIRHDLDYRLRRLNLADQILVREQRELQRTDTADAEARINELRELRAKLNREYLTLDAIQRRLAGEDANDRLSRAVGFWIPDPPWVRDHHDPSRVEIEKFAKHLIDARAEQLERPMKSTADASLKHIALLGRNDPLTIPLLKAWLEFDEVDMHLLPRYAELRGELDPIEYLRFSPIDTQSLGEGASNVGRLGGSAVKHFGAFFDRRWRHNDILWGRLHAAELIIKMLMPDPQDPGAEGASEFCAMREALIAEAQHEIIAQSPDAVAAIGELDRNPMLNATADPASVRNELQTLQLDLSLTGNAERADGWRQILRRLPPALAQVVAAGRFDPWRNRSNETPAQRRDHDATEAAVRRRLERTASTAETIFNLIAPSSTVARVVRYYVLPLMVFTGMWGAVAAYGADREHLGWVGLGLLAGLLGLAVTRRRTPSPLGTSVRALMRLGAAGFVIAGAAAPVVLGSPSSAATAYSATLGFILATVALSMVTIGGAVTSQPWRTIAVGVLGTVSIGLLGTAFVVDRSAMAFLLGGVSLIVTCAAAYVGLASLQTAVDGVAAANPNKVDEKKDGE